MLRVNCSTVVITVEINEGWFESLFKVNALSNCSLQFLKRIGKCNNLYQIICSAGGISMTSFPGDLTESNKKYLQRERKPLLKYFHLTLYLVTILKCWNSCYFHNVNLAFNTLIRRGINVRLAYWQGRYFHQTNQAAARAHLHLGVQP